MVRWSLFLLSNVIAFAPLSAEDFTAEKAFGPWTVYRTKADCWMKSILRDGTEVILSTALKNDKLYISLEKDSWQSIDNEKSYVVRVEFGGIDRMATGWGSAASGTVPPGVGIFIDGAPDAYVSTLKSSSSLRVSMDGKTLAFVTMGESDTNAALDRLRRCTLDMKGAGDDPFARRPDADPFKN